MIDKNANLQIGCLETKWRTGLKRVIHINWKFKVKCKETQQSTNKRQKGYGQNIENYEPEALNKIIEDFLATKRKKDGKDYMSMTAFTLRLNVT